MIVKRRAAAMPAIQESVEGQGIEESPKEYDWKQLGQALKRTMPKINAGSYYAEYHGHKSDHLLRTRDILVERGCSRFIYMIGDSTLDNKHWFFKRWGRKEQQINDPSFTAECVNGFENVLYPARMVKDVAYWLNLGLEKQLKAAAETQEGAEQICALMTSVEESTLADRNEGLLVQDAFVRDHITKDDYLIVSVGGNDIALRPTPQTILYMFLLTRSPAWLIHLGIAPGFGYFVNLFGSRVAELTARVCAKQRPKKIALCMLYYLDQNPGDGWAENTLSKLGYNADPGKLQLIIRTLFRALRKRRIGRELAGEGTCVLHVPLFTALDPRDSGNYIQRVEPSVEGGRQMAEVLLGVLLAEDSEAAIDHLLLHPPAYRNGERPKSDTDAATTWMRGLGLMMLAVVGVVVLVKGVRAATAPAPLSGARL